MTEHNLNSTEESVLMEYSSDYLQEEWEGIELAIGTHSIQKYCTQLAHYCKHTLSSKNAQERIVIIEQLFYAIKEIPPHIITSDIMNSVCAAIEDAPLDMIRQIDSKPHQKALLHLYIKECQITPSDLLYKLRQHAGNEDLIHLTMTLL